MKTILAAMICLCVTNVASTAEVVKQKGVNFHGTWRGAHSVDDNGRRRDTKAYENIKSMGVNWLCVALTGYQDTIESTIIDRHATWTNSEGKEFVLTPSDEEIAFVVTRAHADGLGVLLKPYVTAKTYLTDQDVWHGLIGEKFTTETQWKEWFASYTSFMMHYASLSERCKVEQLCIGTELKSTIHRSEEWRKLVKMVREHYSGRLVYACHYPSSEKINWWDALDYIGIDAYYPLTTELNPTVAQLEEGWQKHIQLLEHLSKKWNKPILFTEIGYPSVDGANMHPWTFGPSDKVDYQEQADLYRAFFEAVYERPWLHGVYWWVWYTHLDVRDQERNFQPYGKPAEQVLKDGYGE